MAKVYINYRDRSNGVRETVDEIDSSEFDTHKEFRNYLLEQLAEQRMACWNGEIYSSRRYCSNWKD